MGDQDHAHLTTGLNLQQGLHHRCSGGTVQGSGGFVKDQDLRLHREGAQQGRPPTLAAGKLCRPMCEPLMLEIQGFGLGLEIEGLPRDLLHLLLDAEVGCHRSEGILVEQLHRLGWNL